MKINLEYGTDSFTGLSIIPEPRENEFHLHNLSREILIKNPAIDFSDYAKAGKLDDYSDEEYESLLNQIKAFNLLFFTEGKPYPYINIFELLERLLFEYLNNIDIYIKKLPPNQ